MEEVPDETLLSITAQFIAELEAGQHPRLDSYIQLYPRYADEIADFMAYYYTLEANLPMASETVPPLSPDSCAALERAWKEAEKSALLKEKAPVLSSLAERQQYTLSQLAESLDLSSDIVEQLAQRQLDPTTLPRELLQRLAEVLAQSMSVVRQTLGLLESSASSSILAERQTLYALPERPTFRQALLSSRQAEPAQRAYWLDILEREGL